MTSRRFSLFAAVATLWPCAVAGAQFSPDQELGRYLATVGGLRDPAGVAIGPDGLICVAEADADRISVFALDGSAAATAYDNAAGLVAPHGLAFADDGLLYVADTGNHRLVALDETGVVKRTWGGYGAGDGRFNRPEALTVAGDRVYVADTGNDRVQVFDTNGRIVTVFGARGREPGEFMRPVGIAVDDDDNVYVADADNQRVQKLDADGTPLHTWGGWGSFPGLFSEPSDVVFRAGLLYVSDRLNHRVQVFDTGGTFLYQWGLHAVVPREGDGKVHYPNALAIAPDAATLVVAEAFENRCQVFGRVGTEDPGGVTPPRPKRGGYSHFGPLLSVDGDLLVTSEPETRSVAVFHLSQEEPVVITGIGQYGTRFGQMDRITGLHVDAATRRVYVADAGNDRLQVFHLAIGEDWRTRYDPALGRFVHAVGLRRLGRAIEPDNPAARLEPVAMKTDADGNLVVLDGHGARVVVFDPEWNLVRWWGGFGDGPGRFVNPVDLALGPGGRVFVADAWGRRVQVFEPDGTFVRTLDGDGSLVRPSAVVASTDGFLYVTDAATDRIIKLDQSDAVVAAWGAPGVEHAEFWKPTGIAQDGQGRIIVHDYGNHRAQVFSADGTWRVTFSAASSYTPRKPGRPRSPQ